MFGISGIREVPQALAQDTAPGTAAETSGGHWYSFFVNRFTRHPRQPSERDQAVELARQGRYDEALVILAWLYQKDKTNVGVTQDYAAVLSWAQQDRKAVDIYETLAPQQEPDYVLAAMGHSYRELNQIDQALAIYRVGAQQYPDNVNFSEGIIRCLIDKGDIQGALAEATDDLSKHGDRPEILADKKEIMQIMVKRDQQVAVQLGREKHYPEALAILSRLYAQQNDNPSVTSDYLAILGWSGGHDDQVVELYRTLPPGDQTDYVLEAVGHAYRNLHQPDQALVVYQAGLKQYPDNVFFAEGAIRSLVDEGKLQEALTMANEDIRQHGNRPEILDIKKNIIRLGGRGKLAHPKSHHRSTR